MKKVIIIFATLILLIIIFIKVTPFYWGMQAKLPKTLQPEMAKVETEFIKKLEIECDCEVKRFFHNYKKESTDSSESKKYNNDSFYYSINFSGKNSTLLDKINTNNYTIAKYLKDSVLKKNLNLNEIIIYTTYKGKDGNHSTTNFNYRYIPINDSLYRDSLK